MQLSQDILYIYFYFCTKSHAWKVLSHNIHLHCYTDTQYPVLHIYSHFTIKQLIVHVNKPYGHRKKNGILNNKKKERFHFLTQNPAAFGRYTIWVNCVSTCYCVHELFFLSLCPVLCVPLSFPRTRLG